LNEGFDFRSLSTIESFYDKYEGDFENGLRHGFGTLFLTNGEKFKGQFTANQANGIGTFYRRNGEEITAEWKNNALYVDY
jgi:hypothetical protein